MGTAAVRRTSRRGTCVKRYGPRSTLNDDDYDEVLSHRGGAICCLWVLLRWVGVLNVGSRLSVRSY